MVAGAVRQKGHPSPSPPTRIVEIGANHAVQHVLDLSDFGQGRKHEIVLQTGRTRWVLAIPPAVDGTKYLRQTHEKPAIEGIQRRVDSARPQARIIFWAIGTKPPIHSPNPSETHFKGDRKQVVQCTSRARSLLNAN